MGADQITTWISEERFAPFLERAGGEEALATELYLWHAQVAGASLTTLHHFEVALRNAIDLYNRQLIHHHDSDLLTGPWLPYTTTEKPCSGLRRSFNTPHRTEQRPSMRWIQVEEWDVAALSATHAD